MSSLSIPIRLRPRSSTPHSPHAWLVEGEGADQWFAEMSQWNVTIEDFRLFVLPIGLLVIPRRAIEPAPSLRTRPYCQVHQNLFIPIDADLSTVVTSDDFRQHFPAGSVYLWHPRVDVLVAKETAGLEVEDLLATPNRERVNWSLAVPGVTFNHRVVSLTPLQPLSTRELWEDAQDDIGTQPLKLENLPSSPTEPSTNPLVQLGSAGFAQLAKGLLWLMKSSPVTARSSAAGAAGNVIGKMVSAAMPSWGSGIVDWAGRQVAKWTGDLEEARNREVSRLLNLLDSDPDAGLRFALPLAGEAGRGVAAPGSHLSERNVNFSLSGRGGAVDGWNLSERYRQQLLTKYRLLANREVALGRHRRAAYIFAQLLGDFGSAARTLADGGFYREAAILYEEKLHQKLEAARCLENGRLWSEALALYEKLGRDEEIGDLYRKLERHDEAIAAYRRYVKNCLDSKDNLSAARMLEQKLSSPSEAIQVLFLSWPHSPQTIRCLESGFKLLGRLGQHDEARKKIRWLGGTTAGDPNQGGQLATYLAALAAEYPDREVQCIAADQTRLLASEHLQHGDVDELTSALRKLVPQDRLLLRDTQRFSRKPLPSSGTSLSVIHGKTPTLVRQIALPPGDWCRLVACGSAFYAAGSRDRTHITVLRGTWEGQIQQQSSYDWVTRRPDDHSLLLAADERFGSVVIHSLGEAPFTQANYLPVFGDLPRIGVGGHTFLDTQTFACGYSDRGTIETLTYATEQGDIRWSIYAGLSAALVKTLSIVSDSVIHNDSMKHALFQHEAVYLPCGSDIRIFRASDGQGRVIQLPHEVKSLIGSSRWTRKRLVASFEKGGMIIWGDDDNAPRATFGARLFSPHTCLTRGGFLVAVADAGMEVYDTREGILTPRARQYEPSFRTRDVVATNVADQFAVLTDTGIVLIYRL